MRIHFHSDCAFFAGSENMLATLFGSAALRAEHDISFSYRHSPQYDEGLSRRITPDFPVFPLHLQDLDEGLVGTNRVRRLLAVIWRLMGFYPLFLAQVFVFQRLLKNIRPDILHINNGGYPGAHSCRSIALAAKLVGVPHVLMVVNNLAVPYRRPARWLDYPIDRLVVGAVDRFVTGSRAAAERLANVLRLPSRKWTAIHNGVRVRQVLAPPEQTRARLGLVDYEGVVFGTVALLESRKGHAVLIDAVARLAVNTEAPQVVLIEGHGDLAGQLADRITKDRLEGVVRLVGDESHIFDFMAALDVLVLPSVRDEDFPNVVIEAMSLGRPVIASRLAGIPEQVEEGTTGLLVEPGNAEELAGAMSLLSRDAALRQRMGDAGRERFEANFTSEVAVRRYLELYDELARRIAE